MRNLHVTQVYDHIANLTDPDKEIREVHKYHVTKVTNSIIPRIGSELSEDQMQYYVTDSEWNVTVT